MPRSSRRPSQARPQEAAGPAPAADGAAAVTREPLLSKELQRIGAFAGIILVLLVALTLVFR